MKEVAVVIGAGGIGQAIARRVGTGKVLCSCENCVRNAIKAADEALREMP